MSKNCKLQEFRLRNLARCRKAYQTSSSETLLENVMLEIEEILFEHDVNWDSFDHEELLEIS
jgi:hypothetical protein